MKAHRGLLSDLLLVRMHGRSAAYLVADDDARAELVRTCRAEATVPDLGERILVRSVYSQASTRAAPLRELVQNALDASPPGARIDVQTADQGLELTVIDAGSGMRPEGLLFDLVVPFASGKDDTSDHADADAPLRRSIGEHGIGFFSVLEIAPRVEVTSFGPAGGWVLRIAPLGKGPRYADFEFALEPARSTAPAGTSIRCALARALDPTTLAQEIASVAGLVDPARARIHVDGVAINTLRSGLRHVAQAPVPGLPGPAVVDLFLGKEGLEQGLTLIQAGLLVSARAEAFISPGLSVHRELARAIAAAGFALVAELPLGVPLNKGRSAVAASAAASVEASLAVAFERFVLNDALVDRELLRAVDHRLTTVLDRLVAAALAGEPAAEAPCESPPSSGVPTVAAPEDVVRFGAALLESPLFHVASVGANGPVVERVTLRQLVDLRQRGLLRAPGEALGPGCVELIVDDPLATAVWRRIAAAAVTPAAPAGAAPDPAADPIPVLGRTTRDALRTARGQAGVDALCAAITVLERIDGAISLAAGLSPSPITVHQHLYGQDEMAHTDGTGISVNLASPRVRMLLGTVLTKDDGVAFGALVDLLVHEKTHVSLASHVPRAIAEHGVTFYRRKDRIRRRLLEALASGAIADPIRWLPVARKNIPSADLPGPVALAAMFAA